MACCLPLTAKAARCCWFLKKKSFPGQKSNRLAPPALSFAHSSPSLPCCVRRDILPRITGNPHRRGLFSDGSRPLILGYPRLLTVFVNSPHEATKGLAGLELVMRDC